MGAKALFKTQTMKNLIKTKLNNGKILISKKHETDTLCLGGKVQKEIMWFHSIGDYNQNIYNLKRKELLSEKQYEKLNNLK